MEAFRDQAAHRAPGLRSTLCVLINSVLGAAARGRPCFSKKGVTALLGRPGEHVSCAPDRRVGVRGQSPWRGGWRPAAPAPPPVLVACGQQLAPVHGPLAHLAHRAVLQCQPGRTLAQPGVSCQGVGRGRVPGVGRPPGRRHGGCRQGTSVPGALAALWVPLWRLFRALCGRALCQAAMQPVVQSIRKDSEEVGAPCLLAGGRGLPRGIAPTPGDRGEGRGQGPALRCGKPGWSSSPASTSWALGNYRPAPAAEVGEWRTRWGSGSQEASTTQGNLGA